MTLISIYKIKKLLHIRNSAHTSSFLRTGLVRTSVQAVWPSGSPSRARDRSCGEPRATQTKVELQDQSPIYRPSQDKLPNPKGKSRGRVQVTGWVRILESGTEFTKAKLEFPKATVHK